jgi:hypothetical protein
VSDDFELPAHDRPFEAYPLYLRAIGVHLRHFPLFAAINLPVALVTSLCLYLGAPTLADMSPQPNASLQVPVNEWLAFAGTLLIALTFGMWSAAAIYRAADAAMAGEPVPGFRAAYSQAIDRLPALLATELLFLLAVMVGTVCCVLPGIWLGVLLLPALPRVATREVGPIDALRDARALVSGRWWRVAFFFLLVVITMYAFYTPFVVLNLVLPHGNTGALIVRGTASLVTSILIATIQPCAYAALHRGLEETG